MAKDKLKEYALSNSESVKYKNDRKNFVLIYNGKSSIKSFMQKNISELKGIRLIIYFDFSKRTLSLKEADKIVCDMKKLDKFLRKVKDKEVYSYVKKGNSPYEFFIERSVSVMNINLKEAKYNYLYDEICEYLDSRVVMENVCGFKDDKCLAKKDTDVTMGCCHHFKNKRFGMLYEKSPVLCEYQKDKRCTAKCITCKMYMCDKLKKQGYSFTVNNVLLIKRYFNIFQKIVIISSFFETKGKIMKKILFFSQKYIV